MGLSLWGWVEKKTHHVETHCLSVTWKVLLEDVSKEGHTESILWYEKTNTYWYLRNMCTCKLCFKIKNPSVKFNNFLEFSSGYIYTYTYIYIYKFIVQIYMHKHVQYHHHHIALVARISLTLSRHSSLSFIALGRSSGQHPVSSHSCWMYVRAGRPAFARPCVGIHKSTSLMSSSLLLQQCPACLVRLTWIVFVIGGRWPYSWCLVGCCFQDLFRIARSILV